MPLNEQQENMFVVLYDTGDLSLKTGPEVSRMYDLADMDHMEGVRAVLAVNQDLDLVPVAIGPVRLDEGYPETGITYGYSDIKAGTRKVGTVAWTDNLQEARPNGAHEVPVRKGHRLAEPR